MKNPTVKANKNARVKSAAKSPNPELTLEAIAFTAYCIWEREGRPVGRDLEHWLQAEAQLGRGQPQNEVSI